MDRARFSTLLTVLSFAGLLLAPSTFAQTPGPQVGEPGRPNYETYRMDKITSQGDASYSGDLNLSLPLLVVPGRHGHDFAIQISYNSHITQSQRASWVGLGWNLDIGAVERTIQGRADDQVEGLLNGDYLGSDGNGPWRAMYKGRMHVDQKTLPAADQDQSDMYNIILDGGSTEAYFIPDTMAHYLGYYGPYKLLTPQYKSWDIKASWPNPSTGFVSTFAVTKEDGSQYVFGSDAYNNGSVDKMEVQGKTPSGTMTQKFSFPYRWSLEKILYPDGSSTRVTYKMHNQAQNAVRRKYESLIFDRSYAWDANLFSPGLNQLNHYDDSLRCWYSSPESLYTDTHYLVFKSSTPSSIDMSAKNRRLDTLILYDRLSAKEIKRVVFKYAGESNPNSLDLPWNDWQTGTMLANDQLTLQSISVRTPDDILVDAIPPYVFMYGKNPKFSEEQNENLSGGDSYYPGYRCGDVAGQDTVFSTAWRLRRLTLPTGGRTEYSYQRLGGVASDSFKVCYDPEGHVAPLSPYSYSFKAQPRCRLVQKRVIDTLGITQIWDFTYGTAVYDSPSRPMMGTYQPSAYASALGATYPWDYDFYKYYRGCPIGHRWAKVTNPDGSWKKTYFTSSYKAGDKSPLESQPDSIVGGTPPNNATIIFSNYANRGMVWKEETNLSSTVFYYSYVTQWKYTDPYRYNWLYNNNYSFTVELRSIWCRLDSIQGTRDGVLHRTQYDYNPTRIQNYGVWNRIDSQWGYLGWQYGVSANGLVSWKTEDGDQLNRFTFFDYACAHYGAIDTLFMLSQPYSTQVSGATDESRMWTTYGKVGSLWLPIANWIWNDSSSATGAPIDTGAPANVRVARYTYDGSSNAAVISQTGANDNIINYYYSSDSTNPFTNNANGLNLGRVTGIEKIRGDSFSPLRTSVMYDDYGNATKLTSENGNVTRCTYDKLGRLTSIVGPSGQKLSDFSYTYFTSSPLQPNILAANTYRGASDLTSSRSFFDGIGYEIQKQTSFGALDIITHTAYDSMRHAAQRFLTYQCDLGGSNEHKYDPSFLSHTKSYNPGPGAYPFELTEFERDPNGRPINQFYPDTVFSTSDRTNNKYTRISYGANGSDLPGFASGSLSKSTTLDENGNNHISYVDKLGNTVVSVVDSGGLALTTQMSYDATGRVVGVFMPKTYDSSNSGLVTGSLALSKPQHSGQIDLTSLVAGGKALTIRLFADVYGAFRPTQLGKDIQPKSAQGGILVVCSIDQYSQGALISHQGDINIGDYPDDQPTLLTLPYVPTMLPYADEVKLVIDTAYWYYSAPGPNCTSGTISLDCQSGGDFSFVYNKRGLIEQKTVPDQGTTKYLYDKNGNLRLLKDAAHTGTAPNSVHLWGNINCPNSTSGQFTLSMPGPVTITSTVGDINESEYVTIRIKANGIYVLSTSSSGWSGSSSTLSLPKGSYSYEVTTTGSYGFFTWDVSCQSGYELVYNKYDALNRVTELGEYSSTSATANFTKTNAEDVSFPGSGVLSRTMLYDTVSTDGFASGQRNLRGKLSQVTNYRLGAVALTSFYSYDDFGRVEWIAHRGFGSSRMKVAYTYDLQNNITKKVFSDSATATNNFMWWYEYDQTGRLARVYSGSDSLSRVKDADYTFSASGKVTQLTLGAAPAQTMTYTYTDRNWLGTIASTQFWEHLGYNNIAEIGSALSSPVQYNGNISWMSYSENGNNFNWGGGQTSTVGYSFGYDKANRLTAGNFGYSSGSWSGHNSYKMPKISYDKNGNIDTLVRYGTGGTLMDSLKYHYSDVANPNRLDYITDAVSAGAFSTDIDNQLSRNYKYDSNGNVQADSGRGMGFIIYDLSNLPVLEFKRDGTTIQYTYETNGQRAIKLVGSSYTWYVPGADGRTEVLYNNATTNPTYNIWGNDNVGQVRRTGIALTRYYYLKDHLGTNRMTVRADSIVLADDFSGTLSQWTTVLGGGFSVQSGELVGTGAGSDNVLINNSAATFGDGVVSADVKNLTGSAADANLVVRYQDSNNYYLIQAYSTQIIIFKKVAGSYIAKASVGGQQNFLGGFFPLQATVIGANFTIYWKGQQVLTWTDPSPWLSGKVGVRQCLGRNIHWDNFNAVTYTTGQVVAYDDFYPFGMQMDGRSTVIGQPDARYKFTGKERDAETGYDYFGARYYDARIGRFLTGDPRSIAYPSLSPYSYAGNNPLAFVDPTGRDSVQAQQLNSVLQDVHAEYEGIKEKICNTSLIEALSDYLSMQGFDLPRELLDNNGNPLSANGMGKAMKKSPNFMPMSSDEAGAITAEGGVVIASYENPTPKMSGHVDLVGSGVGYTNGSAYGSDNLRMIGNSTIALASNWEARGNVAYSFGKSARPTYYQYTAFTPRSRAAAPPPTASSFVQRVQTQLSQLFQNVWTIGASR